MTPYFKAGFAVRRIFLELYQTDAFLTRIEVTRSLEWLQPQQLPVIYWIALAKGNTYIAYCPRLFYYDYPVWVRTISVLIQLWAPRVQWDNTDSNVCCVKCRYLVSHLIDLVNKKMVSLYKDVFKNKTALANGVASSYAWGPSNLRYKQTPTDWLIYVILSKETQMQYDA